MPAVWGAVAAGVVGAGASALGGGKGQAVKPWGPMRQPTVAAAKRIEQGIYQGAYNKPRVAGFTPNQTKAFNQITGLAGQGADPGIAAAGGQLADTMQGSYLNNNPYQGQINATTGGQYLANPFMNDAVQAAMRPMADEFRRTTAPAIASKFAAAGRSGSGNEYLARSGAEDRLAGAMADTAAKIGYQNYGDERDRMVTTTGQGLQAFDAERGRQLAAAGMTPDLQTAKYLPGQMMAEIGGKQQLLNQAKIDAAMAKFNEPKQYALDAFRALSGAPGGSTQQTGGNSWADAIAGGIGLGTAAYGAFKGYGQQQAAQGGSTPRPYVNQYW